jgi:hypothetical protein
MIERIPRTHRYRVTPFGLRAALFFTPVQARLYRPAVAEVMSNGPPDNTGLALQFAKLEAESENSRPLEPMGDRAHDTAGQHCIILRGA